MTSLTDPTPVKSATDAISTLKIDAGVTLPFENMIIAAMNLYLETRKDMDPAIRKEWDMILLTKYKELNNFGIDLFKLPFTKF